MRVQRLTIPELKAGRKYSMILTIDPPLLDAIFLRRDFCDDLWNLYFTETGGSERIITLPGDNDTYFDFITNEPQDHYILIGVDFFIGKFNNKAQAEQYYEENYDVIMDLYNNTEGKPDDILSQEELSDLVAEMFWINHDAGIEILNFNPVYFDWTKDKLENYR